jgi:Rrf2 family protein
MPANTQFSIAVHLMAGLGYCGEDGSTSAHLAESVNASHSFVRRTLAKLSHAGLVITTTGKHGSCRIARDPAKITLLDIHAAIEAPPAFTIHNYAANAPCKVSCNIKYALGNVLERSQSAYEKSLAKMKLSDVLADIQTK